MSGLAEAGASNDGFEAKGTESDPKPRMFDDGATIIPGVGESQHERTVHTRARRHDCAVDAVRSASKVSSRRPLPESFTSRSYQGLEFFSVYRYTK